MGVIMLTSPSPASACAAPAVACCPAGRGVLLGVGVGDDEAVLGFDGPESMLKTKMSARSGSAMAAISLLRSAGVFPSNSAMTFKSRGGLLRRGGGGRGRAPEVGGHVEAQADERVTRGRRGRPGGAGLETRGGGGRRRLG